MRADQIPPATPGTSLPRVGIRIPRWANFAASVMAGVLDYTRLHGRWSLVTENDGEGELERVKFDRHWRGDALITFRCGADEADAWSAAGMPVVNICTEGVAGGPRVIPDNRDAGRLAAEHLLESGVGAFAFIGRAATAYADHPEWAPGARRYTRERLDAFSAQLARRGITPAALLLPSRDFSDPETWKTVRDEVAKFLADQPRPCGIFAADDHLGVVALRACEKLGLRVPDEIAVIGFGDDPVLCGMTAYALSSVVFPGRELGYEAARILHRRMRGDDTPAETIVPIARVTGRESSDVLSIRDAEIAKLVRHIRRHAPGDMMQVSELLAHTTLSASTLKVRFHAALGHGPKREILLTRLRHLRHMLDEGAVHPEKIAVSSGFATVSDMMRFIRRHSENAASEED